jgi:hypothetical protein
MTAATDTYAEVRDDLESLMGDLESSHLLVGFIVTRELETDRNALGHDTTGALFSVQNLLELLKERGDALVDRMMALEGDRADNAGMAVRS